MRLVVRLHNCFTKLCSSESETCKKIHLCETASTESIVLGQVQSLCILLGFALAPWHRVAWSGFQACFNRSIKVLDLLFHCLSGERARSARVWMESALAARSCECPSALAARSCEWRARSQRARVSVQARSQRARVNGERARSALV